jgi:hypothetical protein
MLFARAPPFSKRRDFYLWHLFIAVGGEYEPADLPATLCACFLYGISLAVENYLRDGREEKRLCKSLRIGLMTVLCVWSRTGDMLITNSDKTQNEPEPDDKTPQKTED